MSKVSVITQTQADDLRGQEFAPDCFYNPVQDCNGDWIISKEEIDQTVVEQYLWVKSLPLIDWCGPYIPVSGDTQNVFDAYFSGNTNP